MSSLTRNGTPESCGFDPEVFYDGEVPAHIRKPVTRDDQYRNAILTNEGLAAQFERAMDEATSDEERARYARNAAEHRREIARLESERDQ